MTDAQKRRIAVVASCRDANYIPKVPLAGSVEEGADGITWQTMHNGIKVLADAYYGNRETVVWTSRTAGGKGIS